MSEGRLADFDGATGWLNSPPLTRDGLRGKVVLVDFCTYTCINWLRTLGSVRAWAERYESLGLVVIGVHTPEFPFEAERANVEHALAEMKVHFPIALDPEYQVWNAFGNRYWPAIYLADAEGRIRSHHFGEGAYDETERMIQQLLRESGASGVPDDVPDLSPEGVEAQADWERLDSPETYVGATQGSRFASPGLAAFDVPHVYAVPAELPLNTWALEGSWNVSDRAAETSEPGARIAFRFHARDVNLVLRSANAAAVPFRVTIDGAAPGDDHGLDVDAAGSGSLTEPRLYQLVRQRAGVMDRTVAVEFGAPGAQAYVFTFG